MEFNNMVRLDERLGRGKRKFQGSLLSFRNSPGVIPYFFLNSSINACWLLKPHLMDISKRLSFVWVIS